MSWVKVRRNEFHPDEYEEYLAGKYRRNFCAAAADSSVYILACNIISLGVVIPAFAHKIGASDWAISMIPALQLLGMALPQLLASYFTGRSTRVKPTVFWIGVFQRAPFLLLGGLLLLPIALPGRLLTAVLLGTVFISYLLIGVLRPAFCELNAKIVPERLWGRFKSVQVVAGGAMGVVGGIFVKLIMENEAIAFPHNFAALFITAALLKYISLLFLTFVKEPIVVKRTEPVARGPRDYLRELRSILEKDRNFKRYLIYVVLSGTKIMGMAFFMVFTMEKLKLTESSAGNYALASILGGVSFSLFLGLFADKKGNRKNLLLSNAAYVLACIIVVFTQSVILSFAVFVLLSISGSSANISQENIVYQFARRGNLQTYVGIASTVATPFALAYSLLAGGLAKFGYAAPILLSMTTNILACALLFFFIEDPRQQDDEGATEEAA